MGNHVEKGAIGFKTNMLLLILSNDANTSHYFVAMLPLKGSQMILSRWTFNVKAIQEKVEHGE